MTVLESVHSLSLALTRSHTPPSCPPGAKTRRQRTPPPTVCDTSPVMCGAARQSYIHHSTPQVCLSKDEGPQPEQQDRSPEYERENPRMAHFAFILLSLVPRPPCTCTEISRTFCITFPVSSSCTPPFLSDMPPILLQRLCLMPDAWCVMHVKHADRPVPRLPMP